MKKLLLACCVCLLSVSDMFSEGFGLLWKHIGVEEGLSSDLVVDAETDKNGNVWILSANGLDVYKNGVIRSVLKERHENKYLFKIGLDCYYGNEERLLLCHPSGKLSDAKVISTHKRNESKADSFFRIEDDFLKDLKGNKVLDVRVSQFIRQNDKIYAFTNGDGFYLTDYKHISILKFYRVYSHSVSDLLYWKDKLFIGVQNGNVLLMEKDSLKRLKFGNVRERSPAKFFNNDSFIYCFSGKIGESLHIQPYIKQYYCGDIDDTTYIQLGHLDFSLAHKQTGKELYRSGKPLKFIEMFKDDDFYYLMSKGVLLKFNTISRTFVEFKRDVAGIVKYGQKHLVLESGRLFVRDLPEENGGVEIEDGLNGIRGFKVVDSLLFVFNNSAFRIISLNGTYKSSIIYNSVLGQKSTYIASAVSSEKVYLTDGVCIGTFQYKGRLDHLKYRKLTTDFQSTFLAGFISVSKPDSEYLMNYDHLELWHKDKLKQSSSDLKGRFFINLLESGNYRLIMVDKYGNHIMVSDDIRVNYSYKILIVIFILLIFSLLAGMVYLIYHLFRIRKSTLADKKEMAFAIASKQHLSVSLPHLYNNLFNTISSENEERNVEIFSKISEFSSIVLKYNAVDSVSLNSELEFIMSYFNLYKNIKDRLRLLIRLRVPENIHAEDVMIPTFLLQPILENSIRRFRSDDRNRTVYLNMKVTERSVDIMLSDDFSIESNISNGQGLGMKIITERMDNLQNRFKKSIKYAWHFKYKKKGIVTIISIPYEK